MTYMKRWLFLLVMFCVAGAVQAQTTVSGRVIDQSNSQPMPFATVAVLNQDSTVLTGAVTDNKGEYAIGVKKQGEASLAVSFIGYETAYRKVTVGKSPVEMEAIVLSPDATMLQAVKVVERAPVVEQQAMCCSTGRPWRCGLTDVRRTWTGRASRCCCAAPTAAILRR